MTTEEIQNIPEKHLRLFNQLRQAERLADVGFWEWNRIEDRLSYCSEKYALMLDMTIEECMAASDSADKARLLVHPSDRQRYLELKEQSYGSGMGVDIKYRVVTAKGQTRHLHEISEVITDDSKEIVRISGTIQDITERELAEELLRESESRTRAWLEFSPACTKIVDLDFNLQYMSNAGVEGLQIDDITPYYGKPYPFEFYPKSFRDEMTGNLERVKKTGQVATQEASVLDTEGNEVWFHSTLVPVNNDAGELDYIMVVSIDTTDKSEEQHDSQPRLDEARSVTPASASRRPAERRAARPRAPASASRTRQDGAPFPTIDHGTGSGFRTG